MNINISTKFNIGDTVYIPELYEDFFPNPKPQTVHGISVDADSKGVKIRYYIGGECRINSMPERWLFSSYEECTKWCEENNK